MTFTLLTIGISKQVTIPPMNICPIIQIVRGNVFFTLVPITIHKSRIAPIPSTLIIRMHGLMIKYYVNDIQYILFIKQCITVMIPIIYPCPRQNLSYKYSKKCFLCCDSLRPFLFCDILCQDIYYILHSS